MAVPIAPTVIREAGRIRLFGLNLYSMTDIRDVLSRTPASDTERFRGNSCKGGSPTAPIAVNIVNWNNASRIQIKDFTKYLIDFRPQRNKNLLTLQLSICYFLRQNSSRMWELFTRLLKFFSSLLIVLPAKVLPYHQGRYRRCFRYGMYQRRRFYRDR